MLELAIPEKELFDDEKCEFIYVKPTVLRLEHSLVSVSKWESKWKIPFLSKNNKTSEQSLDYIKCMTIGQNVNPASYLSIGPKEMKAVNDYIDDSMTATTFHEHTTPRLNRQVITSELIYFWMTQYNIPMECQKWHLNRLLTLIRIASVKNEPDKKIPMNTVMSQNRALNEARRKALHTRG